MGGDPTRWKVINGVQHKLCSGPGHNEPTFLPANDKYYYRHGPNHKTAPNRLFSQCRLCVNWKKVKSPGLQGLVPMSVAQPFFLEAVRRVGIKELARRTGLSEYGIGSIVRGNDGHGRTKQYVRKVTLRKLMLELISMRRKREVWHRDTILHGSRMRGHKMKRPKHQHDFYHPQGDADNERRRKWNREHPEIVKVASKRRKKRRKGSSVTM